MLTTFGEVLLVWIPSALGLLLCTFLLLRWLARRGAEQRLSELRVLYPEAFEAFKLTVDYRAYESAHRVDFIKIASHFRLFLEAHGVRNPNNPLVRQETPGTARDTR